LERRAPKQGAAWIHALRRSIEVIVPLSPRAPAAPFGNRIKALNPDCHNWHIRR
jgi:hypothetical protein